MDIEKDQILILREWIIYKEIDNEIDRSRSMMILFLNHLDEYGNINNLPYPGIPYKISKITDHHILRIIMIDIHIPLVKLYNNIISNIS
jgi:hypothetical protein